METHNGRPDEETPLLQGKAKTPLPWGQISLAYLALLAEPISFEYIVPFINQLIKELGVTGGDDRKIGYYAGIIESLFFVAQALMTWQWSRLSDFIGRRPVILFGLLGLSASSFAFGLSRTFTMLVISRCLAGILNGNVGVMKSILGDLAAHADMPQVFAFVPVVFSVGATFAPLYGGTLTKPQERWPHVFRGEFWATYPYFLPSLISGSLVLFVFVVCAIFLKESLPSKTGKRSRPDSPTVESPQDDLTTNDERPLSISTLLTTYSVMIPILNYAALALMDVGFYVLLPLFYSSPIGIGGLGFSPAIIGTVMASFAVLDSCLQGLFAPKVIKRFGAKKTFCWAVLWYYPLILLFPIMSAVAIARGKVGPIIWILLIVQFICMLCVALSYTVIFIFITKAAPNKQSLGSVNGLSQSLTSIARAISPALTTSSFAASKQYNILGGNFVYVVMAMIATIVVVLSQRVPDVKDEDEE